MKINGNLWNSPDFWRFSPRFPRFLRFSRSFSWNSFCFSRDSRVSPSSSYFSWCFSDHFPRFRPFSWTKPLDFLDFPVPRAFPLRNWRFSVDFRFVWLPSANCARNSPFAWPFVAISSVRTGHFQRKTRNSGPEARKPRWLPPISTVRATFVGNSFENSRFSPDLPRNTPELMRKSPFLPAFPRVFGRLLGKAGKSPRSPEKLPRLLGKSAGCLGNSRSSLGNSRKTLRKSRKTRKSPCGRINIAFSARVSARSPRKTRFPRDGSRSPARKTRGNWGFRSRNRDIRSVRRRSLRISPANCRSFAVCSGGSAGKTRNCSGAAEIARKSMFRDDEGRISALICRVPGNVAVFYRKNGKFVEISIKLQQNDGKFNKILINFNKPQQNIHKLP